MPSQAADRGSNDTLFPENECLDYPPPWCARMLCAGVFLFVFMKVQPFHFYPTFSTELKMIYLRFQCYLLFKNLWHFTCLALVLLQCYVPLDDATWPPACRLCWFSPIGGSPAMSSRSMSPELPISQCLIDFCAIFAASASFSLAILKATSRYFCPQKARKYLPQ